ncbi:MAG: dephospho-CoA kinase [Phycisphaerales bacterium]|nr:MAG: dephospho-CoA kinase [Phycisphaerales bacterium]
MGKTRRKQIIGILGGIASGKSTVAAEFAQLGCKVIDADKIAHELLRRQTVKQEIVAAFGPSILGPKGKIDQTRLADIVFADAGRLSALNRIIHPLVLEQVERQIERYSRQNRVQAIVLDMPLLAEVDWAKRCDRLIFVRCSKKTRAERAKKMGLGKKQLGIRESFQISLDNKAGLADNTIENNSDFSALVRQVADIFTDITDNR